MILEHKLDKRKKYKYYRTDGNAWMPQRFWSVWLYTEQDYQKVEDKKGFLLIENSSTLKRELNEHGQI